ncbi:hypothetical protein [Roseibium sp. MMSF_3544]|uniref:hypothetical protein n=1 Tax=unclassified Roseibium TaxID=2629323 RepID=UPI00273DA65E|nr:hypothetical protein [Roseibium sp. MMSF_3544]
MLEPQAKKTSRDIVRDTFTPPRVGLVSWALAAIFMGTIGVASYQFGTSSLGSTDAVQRDPTGVALPLASDVETTASVNQRQPVAVFNGAQPNLQASGAPLEKSQIEVLQLEVVGLRRRLTALAEQNLAYSRRIAALEKEVATAKLSEASTPTDVEDLAARPAAEPRPGVVITTQAPETMVRRPKADVASPESPKEPAPVAAVETRQAPEKDPPRKIALTQPTLTQDTQPVQDIEEQGPVRIVTLPQPDSAPVTTGSIPSASGQSLPDFDDTPTRSTLTPTVITPSVPAGQIQNGEDSQIKRSDFGAVIGHYRSRAAAAKAWADFKEQNEERMRDLRPLLMERQVPDGGIALLVGPFANAADAAVACLHLLDVTELCRPALFAGDPLVTAARFRDTAF